MKKQLIEQAKSLLSGEKPKKGWLILMTKTESGEIKVEINEINMPDKAIFLRSGLNEADEIELDLEGRKIMAIINTASEGDAQAILQLYKSKKS